MKKNALFSLITIFISLFFCFVALEVFFHFLPVSDGLQTLPVTQSDPVVRFQPNQDVTWSQDWNFSLVNDVHVNAQGFVNDQDYVDDGKPVLAVIGDSYVEASMVPYEETLQGRLAAGFDRFHSYSFAASGAPLSQYLVYAEYAQKNYNVQAMAINVVGNDFDESLPEYKKSDIFYQFTKDGNLVLHGEYSPSRLRRIVRKSALMRYLFLNLNILGLQYKIAHFLNPDANKAQEFVGNSDARADGKRLQDSKRIIDWFFELLPEKTSLPKDRILILVDAPRELLYRQEKLSEPGNSYFELMREYFIAQGRLSGFEVIDLTPVFFEEYRKNNIRFEYPVNNHWSGEGHRVAYEQVVKSAMFQDFAGSQR